MFRKFFFIATLLLLPLACTSCGEQMSATTPVATVAPMMQATQPSKPTSAPIHTIRGPAILGANIEAFIAHYGQPNDHTNIPNGDYHFQRYADTTVVTDALIVQTDITDAGGSQKVETINVAPETGNATCNKFFPADAVYKSQIPITSGTGYDKIYYSAPLASQFPASAFSDANANQVKAGTFDVQYLTRPNGTASDCTVQIGMQQT